MYDLNDNFIHEISFAGGNLTTVLNKLGGSQLSQNVEDVLGFEKDMILKGQGAAQLNIGKVDIEGYKFMLPSIDEQKLIGQFFKTIDELIAKQEEKVESGKLLKKALLQKMFV